jgi:hypothetical protein
MRNCQFLGANSSDNFSPNLLALISIHNDIHNSWLALPNFFWLEHPEFSTKLKIETMLSFEIYLKFMMVLDTIFYVIGPPY